MENTSIMFSTSFVLIFLWAGILCIGFSYITIYTFLQNRKSLWKIAYILLTAAIVMFTINIDSTNYFYLLSQHITIHIIVLILFTAIGIASFIQIKSYSNSHITIASIKEGIDTAPAGLAIYLPSGMPVLVNNIMDEIATSITGHNFLDGNDMWEQIEGNDPFIIDGTYWMFTLADITAENRKYKQLTAVDVTKEYTVANKIEAENTRLKDANRRLRRISSTIVETTRQEEILTTKVLLHDELGRVQLATKQHLLSNKKEGLPELIKQWKNNIALLRGEIEIERDNDTADMIEQAAQVVGVKVEWKGDFPKSGESANRLLLAAARESLTNTVKHAGGTVETIEISDLGDQYKVVITNNGKVPDMPVTLGGGLSSLKEMIEKNKGRMTVSSAPRFALTLHLKKD